ncbi:unnamed protein product [Rotaria magnacalcarata]|uniref:Apoptosis inhibitor 5 n=2 Tax=Rotaria magnacalcarata TaxID=392030 RepID=A0A816R5D9_9BILA|nr:unnamed protein product [Rotaria magnacalcarata]CAF1372291.1 unnamed protein product [Rotaria magnacalcarata]CAF2053436.1 unnamed protein product [Rotaria magnacalcarata]CAF2067104.1 unnamed protein product [Rotaria magnacalcarata]CAF2132597.1 unnamed protein product [Rotaria magnacalcarata]
MVDRIYDLYNVLNDKNGTNNSSEALDAYKNLIEAIKQGPQEKKLALQFIAKFCKNFPAEMTKTIEAVIDLCEDEDIIIRKLAIKEFPTLVRASNDTLPRVIGVLIQLLQSNDTTEVTQVQNSIMTIYHINPKETISGILSEIQRSQEDLLRKRALRFICSRIATLDETDLPKDIEEHLVKTCKDIALELDAEEFVTIIKLLSTLRSMQTLIARQELVNMIISQCHLEQGWNGVDTDRLSLVATFMGHAMSLLSKNVHSTKFVVFMLDYVIEHIEKLPLSSDDKLDLFRILAEMCPFCTEFDRPKERLAKLFNVLMTFLPEPPVESEAGTTTDATPDFQFSFIECLSYGLHQLSRKYPDFLIAEENEERVKDFRLRLRYLYRGASSYTTQLKNALNGKVEGEDQEEQKKTRLIAYKICSNVQIMIRDLCRSPPSFKSNIVLSWKPTEELKRSHSESEGCSTTNKNGAGTNTSTVTGPANAANKRARPEKPLYRPPSGGAQKSRRGGYQRY